MVSADRILEVLQRGGAFTAKAIAAELGLPNPKETLPILNSLREQGQVVRRVAGDPDGGPLVARWSLA